MTTTLSKLISKYALILASMYIVSYGVGILIKNIHLVEVADNILLRSLVPWGIDIVLNALTAIIVYWDIKKYSVRTKYVVLASVLFRPVGVLAFLLFFALQETNAGEKNQSSI